MTLRGNSIMDGVRDFLSELVGFEPSQVEEKLYLPERLVTEMEPDTIK